MVAIPKFISETLSWLGENIPKLSSLAIQKISEVTGQEVDLFVGKVITLLFFALVIFFSSKITNKLAKYLVIILSIVLIISIFYSFV